MMKTLALWSKQLSLTRKAGSRTGFFFACVMACDVTAAFFVLQVTAKRVYPFATGAFDV
jgi:hypothetical protein